MVLTCRPGVSAVRGQVVVEALHSATFVRQLRRFVNLPVDQRCDLRDFPGSFCQLFSDRFMDFLALLQPLVDQ